MAVVLAGLLLVSGVAIVVHHLADDVLNCSPPSWQEQKVQETFVRSRVKDAHDLDWMIADCDDDGTGTLSFTTALTLEAARDAFLADTSCSPYRESDADQNDVTCTSGGAQVFIFFETTLGAKTKGELAL